MADLRRLDQSEAVPDFDFCLHFLTFLSADPYLTPLTEMVNGGTKPSVERLKV
jgi:hypothetical protein